MALTELHTRRSGAVPLSTLIAWRLVQALEGAIAFLRNEWVVWRTRRALMALDDRQLADIGLSRAEIARWRPERPRIR